MIYGGSVASFALKMHKIGIENDSSLNTNTKRRPNEKNTYLVTTLTGLEMDDFTHDSDRYR